jgi:iron complex outermembrane recepter protein
MTAVAPPACVLLLGIAVGSASLAHAQQDEEGAEPAEGMAAPRGEVIVLEGEAPASVIVSSAREVDGEELALTPRRAPDDLLALVPGLTLSRHGAEGKGAQIFMRGLDAVHGADLEVRVAGVPINERSNVHGQGYVDLGLVIPEVVRGLRARKGALGLDQGPFATAGTVELDLGVRPEDTGVQLGYEVGSTNRHRVVAVAAPAARQGQAGRTFVAAEAMRDDGYGTNRQASRVAAIAQSRLATRSAGWVELLTGAYAATFGEGGPVPFADYEAGRIGFHDTYGQGEGRSTRALAAIRAKTPLGEHRLELAAHAQWRSLELDDNFTGFFSDPDDGDRRQQQHGFFAGGASARYRHVLTEIAELDAGLELLADRFAQREDAVDAEGHHLDRPFAARGSHAMLGAHLGLKIETERLRAEAGGRGDALRLRARDERFGAGDAGSAVVLSPRVAAAVRVSEGWTVSVGYGHGARPPEARGLMAAGAAELAWMSSRGAEVGARYRIAQVAEVAATAFGLWIPRELILDHVSGYQVEEGATRRLGVEWSAVVEPTSWLGIRGDATLVDARFSATGEPLPGPARLVGSLEARVRHASGLRGGARLGALGARPLGYGAEAAPHAIVDLLAAYPLGALDLSLYVDNVTGARIADGAYLYPSHFDRSAPRSELPALHYTAAPPRMVRVALRGQF